MQCNSTWKNIVPHPTPQKSTSRIGKKAIKEKMGLKDVYNDLKRSVKNLDSTIQDDVPPLFSKTEEEVEHASKVLDALEACVANFNDFVDKSKTAAHNFDLTVEAYKVCCDHMEGFINRVNPNVISNMINYISLLCLSASIYALQLLVVSLNTNNLVQSSVFSTFYVLLIRLLQGMMTVMAILKLFQCFIVKTGEEPAHEIILQPPVQAPTAILTTTPTTIQEELGDSSKKIIKIEPAQITEPVETSVLTADTPVAIIPTTTEQPGSRKSSLESKRISSEGTENISSNPSVNYNYVPSDTIQNDAIPE